MYKWSFSVKSNHNSLSLNIIRFWQVVNREEYIAQKWSFSTKITAQEINVSIKGFFSKYDQIRSFVGIWSYLLKKALMKNFIICAVHLEHPWINYTPQHPYTCYMFPAPSYKKNFQGYNKGLFLLTSYAPLDWKFE